MFKNITEAADKIYKKETGLLIILVIIAIIVRFKYVYPPDFDSYWLHAMAESINKYGFAQWVLHPASLFGYYPLSYPSGLMFFMSTFSALTMLDMTTTVKVTGILLGVLATIMVYILARKLGGFTVGYLSALVFTLSPQVIYYSTNNASGRFLLITFYLFVITILFKLLSMIGTGFSYDRGTGEKTHITWLRATKYFGLLALLVLYCVAIHRTSQLLVLFALPAIGVWLYYIAPKVWRWMHRAPILSKLFVERYKKRDKAILIDVFIVFMIIVGYKAVDLYLRGRLSHHVSKGIEKLSKAIGILLEYQLIFYGLIGIVLIAFLAGIYYLYKKKINPIKICNNWYAHHHREFLQDARKYVNWILLILALALFVLQFFDITFYSPSLEEYQESFFLKGDSQFVIFINFLVNYHTSVSPLLIFGFLAVIYLFLKRKKDTSDIYMMFVILLFAGILVDKRYVRLFITPILCIFVAYGIIILFKFLEKKRFLKYITPVAYACIFMIIILGAFLPAFRFAAFEDTTFFRYQEEYTQTGLYLKSLEKEVSTVTTAEQIAGVQIFAASQLPGATHNVYYYVNKSLLEVDQLNATEIKDTLVNGEKLANLWYLPDWIFGGQYYVGRHGIYLYSRVYQDRRVQRIIEDYNEHYYIHDKNLDTNLFYDSITPVYNKIYDNKRSEVYDLKRGRIVI